MNNISLKDSKTVLASGQWGYNNNIKADVEYSLVDDLPILKIKVTLKNQGTGSFTGYLGYQLDPDPGIVYENTYIPGLGWISTGSNVITSGWTGNYIYNGPKSKAPGVPSHGIAWKDLQPSGFVSTTSYLGVWFPASIPAGTEKTFEFYQLTSPVKSAAAPYSAIESLAAMLKMGQSSNVLSNGGFENGLSGWTVTANAQQFLAEARTNIKRTGTRSLYHYADDAGNGQISQTFGQMKNWALEFYVYFDLTETDPHFNWNLCEGLGPNGSVFYIMAPHPGVGMKTIGVSYLGKTGEFRLKEPIPYKQWVKISATSIDGVFTVYMNDKLLGSVSASQAQFLNKINLGDWAGGFVVGANHYIDDVKLINLD